MAAYVPERGDIVWLTFDPQSGHEQAGRRPALVLSPRTYNRRVGLALFCPLTTASKGYPFEVPLPRTSKISGAVLSDQIKSLDWRARGVKRLGPAPSTVVEQATKLLMTLIDPRPEQR